MRSASASIPRLLIVFPSRLRLTILGFCRSTRVHATASTSPSPRPRLAICTWLYVWFVANASMMPSRSSWVSFVQPGGVGCTGVYGVYGVYGGGGEGGVGVGIGGGGQGVDARVRAGWGKGCGTRG